MSSTVTRRIIDSLTDLDYVTFSNSVGIVVLGLLLAVLIVREVVRAAADPDEAKAWRGFDVATYPLLLAGGFILLIRLISLLSD